MLKKSVSFNMMPPFSFRNDWFEKKLLRFLKERKNPVWRWIGTFLVVSPLGNLGNGAVVKNR
jgi:hypothetical protein